MQKTLGTLTAAAAVLLFSGAALASQAKPAPKEKATHTKASATTGTTLVAKGKIVGYDPSNSTLTITTSKGEERFTVSSTAQIHQGSKSIGAEALANLTGREANVRYMESGGQRTVESVRVSKGGRATAPKKG